MSAQTPRTRTSGAESRPVDGQRGYARGEAATAGACLSRWRTLHAGPAMVGAHGGRDSVQIGGPSGCGGARRATDSGQRLAVGQAAGRCRRLAFGRFAKSHHRRARGDPGASAQAGACGGPPTPGPPAGGQTPAGAGGEDDPTPQGRSRKATCAWKPPYIIRVSKKVTDATIVRCDTCGQPFQFV